MIRADIDIDVLVVGAGPAGLFTALEVASRTSLRIAVIDAGVDIDERVHGKTRAHHDPRVWGVGGAGMFSDGKLCLSLGVGGELGAILSERERAPLLRRVAKRLRALRALDGTIASERRFAEATTAGLEFTYYPVLHLGSDHCADSIRSVRDALVGVGGTVHACTELVELERRPTAFRARLRRRDGEHVVTAGQVVLAMGKVGAHRQAQICRSLGASLQSLPMYVGARLEADRAAAAPLFSGGLVDPKYKLYFDDGSKVKMHCAADGGAVLPLRYDEFVLAGGHARRNRRTTRSSFAVLWNGLQMRNDAIDHARAIMERASVVAPDSLIAQRLVDCFDRRGSLQMDVARSRPSTKEWVAGDLRAVLPSEYFDRLHTFVGRLAHVAPGIVNDDALLFGPAIEWWMSRIETDVTLETDIEGLFVAGDGSGWSQGIVHAAATGLVVADGIVAKATSRGEAVDSSPEMSGRPA